ncbi:MAG TPA: TldD/PmbA family protein, partial [Bryobacteraceae bacterium]|nr:TldD/PmbA family protein [Bryobacteraceae bacterium]
MLTREQAQKTAEKILSFSKLPECAVQFSETEEAYVRFAVNSVTTSGFSAERSFVISSTVDGKTGVARTTDMSDEALKAAVTRSEELAKIAPPNQEYVEPLGKQEYPAIDHWDEATASARAPQLVPHVKAVLDNAQQRKLVAAGLISRVASVTAIANKAGNFGYARLADSRLSTTARTPDGSSSGWASQPTSRISELNGADVGARAAEKCLRWKNPTRLEPGKYMVVLEPTAVGDLLGIAGFAFNARQAEEGRSFFSKKGGGTILGEKLFPEFVTLRSDPFDKRLPSPPWGFGGLPAAKNTWIENGVLKNLAYDRYWAKKSGKAPTPGLGGLILETGAGSVADLIKSCERGLLVTRFWYIRPVNMQTLQLTGLTRDGLFLIEKGEVTKPVVNFRFNESPMRMLQNTRKMSA